MKAFKARVTSKNQLTLPAGVSAMLHVRPGDDVTFIVGDDGAVVVNGPSFDDRVRPWVGKWADPGSSASETDAWIREIRGERE